ncbi:hypothetical protein KK137_06805 [Croceibacterium sp. LX-88]|uniref:Glycosyltransferase RgtA/B/C/D-like domain-containing protein n=1 Tax=Croceibacterium selenioxidans TaxID=2838833 RepID=A0ABS5W498_9SPHN|nr:glycosyltransferase family 39 protein [Croceibacterium selenioxidans]MBT2134040.1 hypothetical protein [Croceibacterium selenioxidans]
MSNVEGKGEDLRTSTFVKAGLVVLGVMLAGIAGRVLSYPLNRDENLFVSVASQLGKGDIYRDFGYNHLPNMPYLLGSVYSLTGAGAYLFTGRLVVVSAWLALIAMLWLIARRLNAGMPAFLTCAFLLTGCVLLLGPSGMLVSNTFLPLPFAFASYYFLLGAMDERRPSPVSAFWAGLFASLAVGFKVNYFFLAPLIAITTLIAPQARPFVDRIVKGLLPLAIGGIVGGLPALIHLARDPDAFLAHTFRYFTELQRAYWGSSTDPLVTGLAQKTLLAEEIWLSNTFLLAIAGVIVLVGTVLWERGLWVGIRQMASWKVLLPAACAAFGFIVAFVPDPAFPQYFALPLPFLVLTMAALAGSLGEGERRAAMPLWLALSLVAILGSVTRIGPGLLQLARPGHWEPLALHRDMRKLAGTAGLDDRAHVVAMTPVMALEAGWRIYPEFAAGQFVYRVAPFIPADDKPYYRTTSATDLPEFLASSRPDAILVNDEEPMEAPLATFALTHNYREIPAPKGRQLRLFVRRD